MRYDQLVESLVTGLLESNNPGRWLDAHGLQPMRSDALSAINSGEDDDEEFGTNSPAKERYLASLDGMRDEKLKPTLSPELIKAVNDHFSKKGK